MKMTLSIRFLLEYIACLEKLRVSRSVILRAAKLTEEDCKDLNRRLPLDTMVNVFAAAEKVLKDPNVGLNAGFKFRISTYAQTGSIYGYCRNMPQVIRTNAKYQNLAIDAGDISYDQELDADTGQIRHFMTFRPYMEDVDKYRHLIDSIVGAYTTAYNWLSWSSGQDILHVDLPYAAPDDLSVHNRLFKCSVKFNQPHMRLEFSEKTIQHEITTFDAEKFAHAEMKLSALLQKTEVCDSLKVAVKAAIRSALFNGKVSTHIVSERMDTTWSVLRKDLIEANFSYRDLLESVRQDIFHESLADGKSFSVIAQDLGYNDQAAFTKAFKRWYDVSPRQWKAAYLLAQTARADYTVLT